MKKYNLILVIVIFSLFKINAQTTYWTLDDLIEYMDIKDISVLSKKNIEEIKAAESEYLSVELTPYKENESNESFVIMVGNNSYMYPKRHNVTRPLDFDKKFATGTRLEHIKSGTIIILSKPIYNASYGGDIHTVQDRENNKNITIIFAKGDKFKVI